MKFESTLHKIAKIYQYFLLKYIIFFVLLYFHLSEIEKAVLLLE